MITIKEYNFNNNISNKLKKVKHGTNWPVVYIMHNSKEAYIGETTDISIRSNQHLAKEIRKELTKINVITDDDFNKSVILDLESFLIKYMSADKIFKLQNSNRGLQNHDYYQREEYEKRFKEIWRKLKAKGLVKNALREIENSDLFKFSPYKSLTSDQYMVVNDMLNVLAKNIEKKQNTTFIVHGGAGTGKTILGIYLLKLLSQAKESDEYEIEEDQVEQNLSDILKINETIEDLKIGLVIPMENLRGTLKRVFKSIKGVSPEMILSPNDVGKSNNLYDLLIVDEAHRLRRRKNIAQYKEFDKNNKKLGLDNNGTELDWILKNSKNQILFYDKDQTIKPTDVRKERFIELEQKSNCYSYQLFTQLRCLAGGEKYIKYIKKIFSDNPPARKLTFKKYELKIFDDVSEMIENIKKKNSEIGLCRTIAGYAWPWKSKGAKDKYLKYLKVCDIEIDGNKYIWNIKTTDWINSTNSINEIGSIHTIQGYDLNYAGIIIGNDLKYDPINSRLYADRNNYYDKNGKNTTSDEELLEYILNIYATICSRGMLGTYIYVCNKELKKYLLKYINKI